MITSYIVGYRYSNRIYCPSCMAKKEIDRDQPKPIVFNLNESYELKNCTGCNCLITVPDGIVNNLKGFTVHVYEVHRLYLNVAAKDRNDALVQAERLIPDSEIHDRCDSEYDHTIDSSTWEITESNCLKNLDIANIDYYHEHNRISKINEQEQSIKNNGSLWRSL